MALPTSVEPVKYKATKIVSSVKTRDPNWRPERGVVHQEPVVEAPVVVEEPAEETEFSGGTVSEVKEWVGEDTDRAQRALQLEVASEKPRISLVSWLEDILFDTE